MSQGKNEIFKCHLFFLGGGKNQTMQSLLVDFEGFPSKNGALFGWVGVV